MIDWVAQGLDRELDIKVTNIESLPINWANWNTKALRISFYKFGDGIRNPPLTIQFALLVDFFNLFFELFKILNYQFVDQQFFNIWNVMKNNFRKLCSCQVWVIKFLNLTVQLANSWVVQKDASLNELRDEFIHIDKLIWILIIIRSFKINWSDRDRYSSNSKENIVFLSKKEF